MTTAQRLFIGYGTAVLVVGFALGTVLGLVRLKAPDARSLATAHVETLMQASLHLALAFAVGAVGFGQRGGHGRCVVAGGSLRPASVRRHHQLDRARG
jgi:hypothetical protein